MNSVRDFPAIAAAELIRSSICTEMRMLIDASLCSFRRGLRPSAAAIATMTLPTRCVAGTIHMASVYTMSTAAIMQQRDASAVRVRWQSDQRIDRGDAGRREMTEIAGQHRE